MIATDKKLKHMNSVVSLGSYMKIVGHGGLRGRVQCRLDDVGDSELWCFVGFIFVTKPLHNVIS